MTGKTYLSIEQVAKFFGINPTTVYRLAQRGMLPGFKVGSQWRFSREMLESWVADQITVEWLQREDLRANRLGGQPKRHRSSSARASQK